MEIPVLNYITTIIISFIMGIIVCYFIFRTRKNTFSFLVFKIKRFIIHFFKMMPVFIALAIVSLLFYLINYGSAMLPNIISSAVSILVIDYLIKEREISGKARLEILLKDRIGKIVDKTKKILLQFMEFENYNNGSITPELLTNLLNKQNLNELSVEYIEIKDNGYMEEMKISKFDFLYYIGKELRPLVSNLIANYGIYLSSDQLCELINLENILEQRIFSFKVSSIGNLENENYKKYQETLVKLLCQLYEISNKLKY